MSGATYFVRECPTCGRRLQIRLEYLGHVVACQHCNGKFAATDPALASEPVSESAELLSRVDQLLASSATQRVRPR
jgi:ribosomal protein L37AE/L43A